MKLFCLLLLFLALNIEAKEVKDFNRALVEGVQRDLKNDNVDRIKTDKSPMRGPASVDENVRMEIEPENKIQNNVRQTGGKQW